MPFSPGGWVFGIWARVVQVFKAINLKNPGWLREDNDLVGGVFLRGEPASGEGAEQSFRPHGEAQGLPRALRGEGTSVGGLQLGNFHSLPPSTRGVPGNVALCSHKNRDGPRTDFAWPRGFWALTANK